MKRILRLSSMGFSLVEMMIGMTITLLIVGAFINLFIKQNQQYMSENLRQEMSLNGRTALDEIQREAMNAGTGLPGLFSSVQVFDGGPDNPDTVTFIYVPPSDLTLKFSSSPKPNASANSMKFSVDSDVADLVVGDHLIIYDESDFNIIEITSINVSSGTAVFVPPAGVNSPTGLAKAYDPPTTIIARVSLFSLTVDETDPERPELVKFRGSELLGAVAMDIENLQVTIIFADGDTASVADDIDSDDTNDSRDLRAVKVHLKVRSPRPDPHYQEGDHYYRQEFSSTIAPRNIIYGG
jgi:type II secretory pathway pseudopilin PulG